MHPGQGRGARPRMRDLVLVIVLVTLFATAFTTHVAIVAGLARRSPRWRAAAAFVVPPLAPFWAFSERMRLRAVLWCVSLAAYLIALLIARR